MALYAIGDTHLSLGTNKPMDVFGGGWSGYVDKLRAGFADIGPEDTVVLCGDLSWGMGLEQAREDFAFLNALPGRKILLKDVYKRQGYTILILMTNWRNPAMTITKDTIIGDILNIAPETAPLFMNIGMHCLGCPASRGETVEQACMVHGVEVDELLAAVNQMIADGE